MDEFPLNEKVGLQLAGLHAQVLWGDYDPNRYTRYNEVEQYIHPRILASNKMKTREDWKKDIAEAHEVSTQTYIYSFNIFFSGLWYWKNRASS